ncbi:Coatomer subunit gamma [Papilio machaon]|uniref:Coatomer subunit gamma n=1 Tax=Papilio machaon TaxID=76193 RepID=A0A0N1PIW6_PAPMA|nr:Coatomer subunit gamma [Papilio machaon]
MSSFKRDKKEEEDSGGNPYQNLDKTIVLQEARYFNETPVNPRKCIYILSKILYLLNQGEKFTTKEATDVFFATTKLFQSKNVMLRRMVYLCIKELSTMAQDIIIVTSSLTKDMTGKEDLYRPAAIRALCSITDSTMLQAIERYMKQAIVDKNPAVSSAALVSALHLSSSAPDLVRRWVNEAQEAMNSDDPMVCYHALGLVAGLKKNDKLSTVKLITRYFGTSVKSPYMLCLLIRFAAQMEAMNSDDPMVCYHALGLVAGLKKNDKLSTVKLITRYFGTSVKSPYMLCLLIRFAAQMVETDDSDTSKRFIDFIEYCLRHKSEMVIYEAAHAIVNLKKPVRDLAPAVSVLQLFCGSSKASLRLAGARTLACLTAKRPTAVAACTVDLENLISDPNRSVATLAVTTLLATGAESSIDRLMKQISSFVSEISDEFKIIVVKAIRRLCTKFPRKHQSIVAFLAGMLRDEGGLEFKAAIADAIIEIVEENPDAKETGLAHLCEFIEDCEHSALAVRILHLLGREGPKSRQPSRYIRFIYNRVILESGPVRAAAVSAVAQFGAQRPEMLPNIKVLLSRCELDDEDEVRDRAIFYNAVLDTGDQQLINDYIINVVKLNPIQLEKALREHIATKPDETFDIMSVPTEELNEDKEDIVEVEVKKPTQMSTEEMYNEMLSQIPGIERLGPIFKRAQVVELTEPETEYTVRLYKHTFARHIILQFECVNTLNDQQLEQVHVRLETPPEYNLLSIVPCQKLVFNKPDSVFVVVEFPSAYLDSLGTFGATLEFVVRDCDPNTGNPDPGEGYADSYPLEEFDINCADQIKTRTAAEDFEETWECAANSPEASDTFALPYNDIEEAGKAVCRHLALPNEAVSGDAIKEIKGCGIFRGGAPVLMKAKLVAINVGVTMKLAVRSPREDIAQLLLSAIG